MMAMSWFLLFLAATTLRVQARQFPPSNPFNRVNLTAAGDLGHESRPPGVSLSSITCLLQKPWRLLLPVLETFDFSSFPDGSEEDHKTGRIKPKARIDLLDRRKDGLQQKDDLLSGFVLSWLESKVETIEKEQIPAFERRVARIEEAIRNDPEYDARLEKHKQEENNQGEDDSGHDLPLPPGLEDLQNDLWDGLAYGAERERVRLGQARDKLLDFRELLSTKENRDSLHILDHVNVAGLYEACPLGAYILRGRIAYEQTTSLQGPFAFAMRVSFYKFSTRFKRFLGPEGAGLLEPAAGELQQPRALRTDLDAAAALTLTNTSSSSSSTTPRPAVVHYDAGGVALRDPEAELDFNVPDFLCLLLYIAALEPVGWHAAAGYFFFVLVERSRSYPQWTRRVCQPVVKPLWADSDSASDTPGSVDPKKAGFVQKNAASLTLLFRWFLYLVAKQLGPTVWSAGQKGAMPELHRFMRFDDEIFERSTQMAHALDWVMIHGEIWMEKRGLGVFRRKGRKEKGLVVAATGTDAAGAPVVDTYLTQATASSKSYDAVSLLPGLTTCRNPNTPANSWSTGSFSHPSPDSPCITWKSRICGGPQRFPLLCRTESTVGQHGFGYCVGRDWAYHAILIGANVGEIIPGGKHILEMALKINSPGHDDRNWCTAWHHLNFIKVRYKNRLCSVLSPFSFASRRRIRHRPPFIGVAYITVQCLLTEGEAEEASATTGGALTALSLELEIPDPYENFESVVASDEYLDRFDPYRGSWEEYLNSGFRFELPRVEMCAFEQPKRQLLVPGGKNQENQLSMAVCSQALYGMEARTRADKDAVTGAFKEGQKVPQLTGVLLKQWIDFHKDYISPDFITLYELTPEVSIDVEGEYNSKYKNKRGDGTSPTVVEAFSLQNSNQEAILDICGGDVQMRGNWDDYEYAYLEASTSAWTHCQMRHRNLDWVVVGDIDEFVVPTDTSKSVVGGGSGGGGGDVLGNYRGDFERLLLSDGMRDKSFFCLSEFHFGGRDDLAVLSPNASAAPSAADSSQSRLSTLSSLIPPAWERFRWRRPWVLTKRKRSGDDNNVLFPDDGEKEKEKALDKKALDKDSAEALYQKRIKTLLPYGVPVTNDGMLEYNGEWMVNNRDYYAALRHFWMRPGDVLSVGFSLRGRYGTSFRFLDFDEISVQHYRNAFFPGMFGWEHNEGDNEGDGKAGANTTTEGVLCSDSDNPFRCYSVKAEKLVGIGTGAIAGKKEQEEKKAKVPVPASDKAKTSSNPHPNSSLNTTFCTSLIQKFEDALLSALDEDEAEVTSPTAENDPNDPIVTSVSHKEPWPRERRSRFERERRLHEAALDFMTVFPVSMGDASGGTVGASKKLTMIAADFEQLLMSKPLLPTYKAVNETWYYPSTRLGRRLLRSRLGRYYTVNRRGGGGAGSEKKNETASDSPLPARIPLSHVQHHAERFFREKYYVFRMQPVFKPQISTEGIVTDRGMITSALYVHRMATRRNAAGEVFYRGFRKLNDYGIRGTMVDPAKVVLFSLVRRVDPVIRRCCSVW